MGSYWHAVQSLYVAGGRASVLHPREHPQTFCIAQLRQSARSDYNSMDEWGSVQYGGAIQMAASARAHRMPVPW
eukprot:170332-Prymnesium_polylepis.1